LIRKSNEVTKYVFVTGGVLSSVGKGSVCASIGKILQVRNHQVTAIKIDPYLNVDAGTMNPYMHGEVFVCEDGGEMDLDLGTYERFLDLTISREANITTGQIYWQVIDKERRGDFLGECVQIIPHITDEIKRRIRKIGAHTNADVVLVECGGTIGDIEGLPFFEAFRQIRLEEGIQNTVFVHVPLVPTLDVTKEQKSKPAQHSIQELRRIGLQPDLIVARCRTMLSKEVQAKIALFGSVENDAVFASPNVETVYQLPLTLDQQGLGNIISNKLNLPQRTPDWTHWTEIVNAFLHSTHTIHIAVCGKYAKLADSYISINEALKIAAAVCHCTAHIDWIETESIESQDPASALHQYEGILVPGGFGERGTEGKIAAIKFARETNIPFLGLCFGFQLAVVEFARNVCALTDANSTEINGHTPHPVITLLPEQGTLTYMGATMRLGAYPIAVTPQTLAANLYRVQRIYERHRHRYEVNPEYIHLFEEQGLTFSGTTEDKTRMEILELPSHYFYLATQFHPEFKSRPGRPDPAFYGFVKAILDQKDGHLHPTFDHQILERAEARVLQAQFGV